MRPLLKVSRLISLQDARSSAAVGFDLISFSLERGSDRKLSPAMAWNIVQWLAGPEIVLELNTDSLPELRELDQQFAYHYVSLPLDEWTGTLPTGLPPLILRGDLQTPPDMLVDIAAAARAAQQAVWFELTLDEVADLVSYQAVLPQTWAHFSQPEHTEGLLNTPGPIPFGLTFGPEWEEEPGVLDYARIDDFMERFADRFPAD